MEQYNLFDISHDSNRGQVYYLGIDTVQSGKYLLCFRERTASIFFVVNVAASREQYDLFSLFARADTMQCSGETYVCVCQFKTTF
jgi:hypothetical protein